MGNRGPTLVGASHRQDQAIHFPLTSTMRAAMQWSENDLREPAATQEPLHKHQHCPAAQVPPSRGDSVGHSPGNASLH